MSKSSFSNLSQSLYRIGKKTTDCALNRIERRKKNKTRTDKNDHYCKTFFSDFSHHWTTSKKRPIICTNRKNQPIILEDFFSSPPSKGLNSEMVLWFQNCPELLWEKCSSDRENLLIFEAEGQEFAKILRSLARTIYLNKERSEEFLKQSAFLTCSWRFLKSNTLEQLYFKLEKRNIGIYKSIGKVRNKWRHFFRFFHTSLTTVPPSKNHQ